MAVILKNVAAMAGVAPITVSRVLNNSPLVTNSTREKVLAVCRSTGYQPHAGARALRSKRFNTVGLLLPSVWINIKWQYDCIYPDIFSGAKKQQDI